MYNNCTCKKKTVCLDYTTYMHKINKEKSYKQHVLRRSKVKQRRLVWQATKNIFVTKLILLENFFNVNIFYQSKYHVVLTILSVLDSTQINSALSGAVGTVLEKLRNRKIAKRLQFCGHCY